MPPVSRPPIGRLARWGVITALVAACGDGSAPGSVPDVAGSWAYSETVTHQSAVTCTRAGTLSFEQERETLVGTYARSTSCGGSLQGTNAAVESGTILRGQAAAGKVEFDLGACQYRGDVVDDRPHRLVGTVLCATGLAAADVASGSWVAERLTD